ncbi:MAG: glycoside hydrolase, partial [Candidatus Cryptobacteroides sp.]
MKRTLLLALALLSSVLSYSQHLEDDIVLKNDRVELRFGGSDKNFFFRYFYFDGVNILPASGSTTHPWELTLLGPNGENPVIQPKFTYYKGGKFEEIEGVQKASFTWNLVIEAKEWPLTITASLDSDDRSAHWDIQAELPEGWVVTKADFPRISVKRFEGDVKGILPFGYGAEYDMPTGGQLQMRYPSCTGVLQLVMMHNGEKTICLTTDDKSASNKFLGMKGEGSNVVFYQSVPTSYAWSEQGHFSLPWTAELIYSPEGWEDTARKVYKPFSQECQWGSKPLKKRKIADWLKNADLWLRPIDVDENMLSSLD